jgi:hypothetical protein
MRTLPLGRWIANAAACLTGVRGAVTNEARRCGCSRKSVYDHTQKVVAAVEVRNNRRSTREPEELVQENEALRQENGQLWDWQCQTIEFPVAKQQRFAVTAMAMGLSHSQIRELFVILMGLASPGRSTIHRWVQAAAVAAGAVLKRLDGACKTLVLVGCLDEIFLHRRPVLVGVEPKSMVWFLGKKADDHQASTWFRELQPWTSLNYVVSDAGCGLRGGLAQIQRYQLRNNQAPLERGLDVFHIKREAQRVLNVMWRRVERCWEKAEAASGAVEKKRRQGLGVWGLTRPARVAWEKASRLFQLYEKREAAWKRAELALNVFRPDGQLNDRAWAEEQAAWAVARLPGSAWSRLRGFLRAKEAFAFLDRLHKQLSQLSLPELLRDALVQAWWLRRQRPIPSSETAVGGYGQIAPLVQQVLIEKLDPNWSDLYRKVASVLNQTVRASSVVECMNSIVRMHQSRHRTMTQPMLDVKRLYWNTRAFRRGKRKGRCPYEHAGLKLASYDFWALIQAELRAIRSTRPGSRQNRGHPNLPKEVLT